MKKSLLVVLMSVCAAGSVIADEAAAPAAVATKGKMLTAANGARLGEIYRVNADGSASVIVDGKMVNIPGSTITLVDGKLTTSLSKNDLIAHR